jgi:hypothetical protein
MLRDDDHHPQWQYLYIWQTNTSRAGTCRQFIVKFNDGGAVQTALFKFVR